MSRSPYSIEGQSPSTSSKASSSLPSAPCPRKRSSSSTFVLPPSSRAAFPTPSPSSSSFPLLHGPNEEESAELSLSKPLNKNRKTGNPPRPPNAWICYRSARVHELKSTSQYSKMPQASISKLIGELWRSEPPEVKRKYEQEAAAKKIEHQEKYPDYMFRPIRREQVKKTSLKRSTSDASKRPSKLDEIPSVLLPAPPQSYSSLPPATPTFHAEQYSSHQNLAAESDYPFSYSPYSVASMPPTPSAEYEASPSGIPAPAKTEIATGLPAPPPNLAPVDTSHGWTMFQPDSFLPTPPFDSLSRAPSPPIYPHAYPPSGCISPSYSVAPSSSSSHSFDHSSFDHFDPQNTISPEYLTPSSASIESPLEPHLWPPSVPIGDFALTEQFVPYAQNRPYPHSH